MPRAHRKPPVAEPRQVFAHRTLVQLHPETVRDPPLQVLPPPAENDVNLAVQGEAWQGAGQGLDNLALIALGTGIGGGLVVGGELVRGADNAAGELGFLPFGAGVILMARPLLAE